jgi:hypothetical protein
MHRLTLISATILSNAAMGIVLTPRMRVEIALRGGYGDRVPFTLYEQKIPQCSAERDLRNRGLCIVERRISPVKTHRPNITTREQITHNGNKRLIRTFHSTPAGELSSLQEDVGFTTWFHEYPFKSPDNYKAILALINDATFEEDYATFLTRQQELGEDFILRAGFGLEPLQELITGNWMSIEDFCMQWMENRDEILRLYDAIVEQRRKIYPLIARSPALHANYGGNVIPEIISPALFRQYYLPHYHEAAEIMHRHHKLIGSHFDDDCASLAQAINETALDYIEAFTPAPDTNMTLAQARAAWPNKTLWLNFPSSQHLKGDAEIRQITLNLLDEAPSMAGLLMGVTEDMPPTRWQQSCTAIMDGLEEHPRLRIDKYKPA